LERAVQQLAEEGAAKAFKTRLGSQWIVGVVGALQFEVLADRIRTEYEVPCHFEPAGLHTARWLIAADSAEIKRFSDANSGDMADDHDGVPVFLARNYWHLQHTEENWTKLTFQKTREQSY
jgi:peptide chain release factor 3